MILQSLHSCLTFFSKSGLSCASYRGVWFSGSSRAIVSPPPPPPPQPAAARPARASSDTTAAAGLLRLRHLRRLLLFWSLLVMSRSFGSRGKCSLRRSGLSSARGRLFPQVKSPPDTSPDVHPRVPWRPTTSARRAGTIGPVSGPVSSNGEVLALEGISKSFGPVQALEGVDFSVRTGEVVALVGDNGAGKSTLVKVISGIHRPDSGRILFGGRAVTIAKPSDAVALGIATVHQDLALCDNLDVVSNLFLGREEIERGAGEVLRSLDETDMERISHEVLGSLAVTITDVRAEVGTMSGGKRQQVAIARSLLGRPMVMILDEPTAALGVRQTAQVLDLIKRLRDQGQGVVLVNRNGDTHGGAR